MGNKYTSLPMVLLLCMGFSSCNNEAEYFEKAHLAASKEVEVDKSSGSGPGIEVSPGDGLGGSNPGVVEIPSGQIEASESFKQSAEAAKKLDIIWIVDNSGSMSDEQSDLGSNFSSFIDSFLMKDVDFKMAITTTDTSSEAKKGLMVSGSDVKLTSAKAKENAAQFKADFKQLVNVGIRGSGTERGLAASEGFMQKYASSFIRPDAYLAVVILSDEQDSSAGEVKHYTDFLKSSKSSAGLIKVYSIVDVNNTRASLSGSRYKEASNLTSGIIGDIKDDFHSVLTEMGDSLIKLLDSFALAGKPVEGSIKVYVNGVQSSDFQYDAASNAIKFSDYLLPPVGADIKVTYLKQK